MNVPPNRIVQTQHLGQPGYVEKTTKISYKLFDDESFFDTFDEQNIVSLKSEVSYCGLQEEEPEEDNMQVGLSALDLIRQAREKGRAERHLRKRPSSKSMLVVGFDGRTSREIEIIWWPNVYKLTQHGRLIVRMFINKCKF